MAGDDPCLAVDQDGVGPAVLQQARCDLADLLGVVGAGVALVGLQAVYRPVGQLPRQLDGGFRLLTSARRGYSASCRGTSGTAGNLFHASPTIKNRRAAPPAAKAITGPADRAAAVLAPSYIHPAARSVKPLGLSTPRTCQVSKRGNPSRTILQSGFSERASYAPGS